LALKTFASDRLHEVSFIDVTDRTGVSFCTLGVDFEGYSACVFGPDVCVGIVTLLNLDRIGGRAPESIMDRKAIKGSTSFFAVHFLVFASTALSNESVRR